MPIFNGLWVIVLKIFKLLWMIEVNTFHTTHAAATQACKTLVRQEDDHEKVTFAMKGRLLAMYNLRTGPMDPYKIQSVVVCSVFYAKCYISRV